MIIYIFGHVTLITLCFCRITYLWVRHKRENAVVDYSYQSEIEENGIIATDSTAVQTIGRFNHNRDYFIPLRERYGGILEEKEDFLPKKKMKYHTLVVSSQDPTPFYIVLDGVKKNEAEDEGCGCDTACNCYDTTIYDL
jgi:hypothetical protein